MNFEIDFIGISKEATNADAICFRYYCDELKRYVIGVYDGGTKDYGEALKNHLNKYYFNNIVTREIDFVICSHPDQDHASGLAVIFENFKVMHLVMNRPWLYIDELFDKVNHGQITKKSLEERLRKSYSYVDMLEKVALKAGTQIHAGFSGAKIYDNLTILSPTKTFYLDMLVESDKTPLEEKASLFGVLKRTILNAVESWSSELLREDVSTSSENETSLVLYADMGEDAFMLTGDAGIRALRLAVETSKKFSLDLAKIKLHQIPHHGSRHNVSPSILNELVGSIKSEGTTTAMAFVSVSKGSDHPRKMVTNAYKRRGAKVFEARTAVLRHSRNMPDREGWTVANQLPFFEQVKGWD